MKTILNRIVSVFTSLVVLTVMVIPAISFAETNEDFTECIIPIISNKSETTEWRGLRKDGNLYITLEDVCELTGSEIADISGETFTTQRNTVKLYGGISDKACLCVTMADYRIFNWNGEYLTPLGTFRNDSIIQDFSLDVIEHDGVYFVEMMPYVYAFGAEISKFSKENIVDLDETVVSELLAVYNINFEIFDSYYVVDTGIPFDEVLTEYMNSPDYRFEWKNWDEKAGAGVYRLWDVIVDDYDGLFNYAFDSYESDMLYNEALIAILQCKPGNFEEEKTLFESLKEIFSVDTYLETGKKTLDAYNQFCNFAEFTGFKKNNNIIKAASGGLEYKYGSPASIGDKGIMSSVSTLLQFVSYYNTLSKFDEIESNILQRGILEDKDDIEYNKENIGSYADNAVDWFTNNYTAEAIFLKFSIKSGAAKYQKLLENYRGLYDSAEKLNNQIKDKRKIIEDLPEEIVKNMISVVLDFVINEFAQESVPYLSAVDFVWNTLKVIPGAEVSDASKAEYIQRIALDRVSLDSSEKSYYSLILAMQSSYYAYSRMLTFEKRMAELENTDTNDEDLKHRIESYEAEYEQNIQKYREICSKLSELITKAYCSNRLFYGNMNSDWEWTLAKELTGSLSKDIPDYSVDVENFSADAIVEQNFIWHIEPTIEAEDINTIKQCREGTNNGHYIEADVLVISKDNKYGLINNNGDIVVEIKYDSIDSDIDNHIVLIGDEHLVYCTKNKITTSNEHPAYHCDSCGPLGTTYYGSDYVYDINRNLLAKVSYRGTNGDKLWLSGGQNSYGIIDNIDTVSAQSAIFPDDIDDINSYGTYSNTFGIVKNNTVLLPFEYENATDFKNGIVAICKDGKWGYANNEGEIIIPFEYDGRLSGYFESSISYVPSDKYIALNNENGGGYYDDKGNEVIPVGTFEEVRPVHNGLAWVKFGGKWGVIELNDNETDTESNNSPETTNWKQLYADELKRYMASDEYNNEAMFDLYDINSDDIPELFVSPGTMWSQTGCIYTVFNEKLVNIGVLNRFNKYSPIKKVLYSYDLTAGSLIFSYKNLENDLLITLLGGHSNSVMNIYNLMDEDVSVEKYNEEVSKYEADDYVDVGRKYKLDEETINSVLLNEQETTATTTEMTTTIAEIPEYGEYNNLRYILFKNEITITGCNNKSVTNLEIPSEIYGLPVTTIGSLADCDLTSIIIPNGVKTIGYMAFENCNNLMDITIPDSVVKIEYNPFQYTPWLKKKREENPLVIVNSILIDGTTCNGDVVIPKNVTEIGAGAFSGSNINSITIPDSVISIGDYAFGSCNNLLSVIIPKNVKECKTQTFNYCENLKEITFLNPECKISLQYIGQGMCKNGVIKGYKNSTAQEYAERYGYEFKVLEN